MITSATIYGTPDETQDVHVYFEYIVLDGMYLIQFCEIKLPLFFSPSDIKTDLEVAIAEELNVPERLVKIDCKIVYEVREEKSKAA